MRPALIGLVAAAVLGTSWLAHAQVYRHQESPPVVTAERATWHLSGQPLFYAGAVYDPTGPTVFFDGRVMVRTGHYEGVPLYQDVTLEPYSIVYVPVGGTIMRPYERRRDGPLVGTVGSRMPSRPIRRDLDVAGTGGRAEMGPRALRIDRQPGAGAAGEPGVVQELDALASGSDRAVGSTGSAPPTPSAAESIPAPQTNDGLWIEFNGARWFARGAALPYDAARFDPVGVYHQSPVYRDRASNGGRIFVALTVGGPLTPFIRR